jgi:large subunit ribosomal protein L25
MAQQHKLSARPRQESGSNAVKAVRHRDAVPAVIYGASVTPLNLEVSRRDVEVLLSHAAGESILVDLAIEEGNSTTNRLSLIQEVQHHPVRGDILHVDFHAVQADELIEASIPLEAVGESDGVKNFGGILEIILRELPIRCLPQNLPEILEVDVTKLAVGDSIHVRDLVLPQGVEAGIDGEVTVLSVAPPNVAVADTPSDAPAAPEVIKEKKPEA